MTTLAVARALRIIGLHPSILKVEARQAMPGGMLPVTVDIETRLWAAWRAVGESPSGVRAVEPVTLTFSPAYPTVAPRISLRPDFRRDHPHLMPVGADRPPVPCIVDGRIGELIELRGIQGLVEQLVEWLERAAMGTLIDATQGWEPARRDGMDDILVIDGERMRALADPSGGARLTRTTFSSHVVAGELHHCIDHRDLAAVNVRETRIEWQEVGEGRREGFGIGMVVWPADLSPGGPLIIDTYKPETVETLGDLRSRAGDYGCRARLDALLNQVAVRLHSAGTFQPTPLAVTLLVRRPCNVIGTTSPIEVCSYVVDVRTRDDLIAENRPVVRLCALRDRLSLSVLRRASGQVEASAGLPWTLVGCGSVGSKVAVHMARRGLAPTLVIDNGFMSPHNYARHALLPERVDQRLFTGKATALADALATLGQRPAVVEANAIVHLSTSNGRHDPRGGQRLLNTTASALLREYMAFLNWEDRPALGEAHLLGAGKVAYAAFEGEGGNPNLSDLAVDSYRLVSETEALAASVFSAEAEEVAVGQGCNTLTFPMPDDRLSALTAGLASVVAGWRSSGLAPDGEIRIGHLDEDGLSQAWRREVVPAWVVLPGHGGDKPGVRLSARVDALIRAEVDARPGVETGGVLVGRFSQSANAFQVVDVLPAPPDSTFALDEFVLGTEGLRAALDRVVRSSRGTLYVLGTWHNHLGDFGPSPLDVTTALGLALQQFFPVLMLIALPGSYTYVTAESFDLGLSSASA